MNIYELGPAPELQLTRDPLRVRVKCNSFYTGGGRERWRLRFTALPTEGNQMNISFMGFNIEMSCVAVGTALNGENFTEIAGTSMEAMEYFCVAMLLNPAIQEHWDVYPTAANTVEWRAKVASSDSDLTIGFVDWTPEFLEQQDGQDVASLESVLLMLRLRMTDTQQAVNFKPGPWMEFVPVVDGTGVWEADVNLSEMADAMMQGLDVPGIMTAPIEAALSARRYYVEAAAYSVSTGAITEILATNKGLVLKGGRKTVEHDMTSVIYLSAKGWLTNRPLEVLTHKAVPDYLWYWSPKGTEGVTGRIKYTAYFLESTVEVVSTFAVNSQNEGRIMMVRCGWDQQVRALFSNPAETPIKYEVQAYYENDGVVTAELTPTMTFYLAPDTVNHGAVHYFNSFGLLEAQYCTGAMQLEREYDRETIRKVLPVVRGHEDMAQRAHGITQQEKLRVTTGPLTKAQQAGAVDMVLSERLWWININTPVAQQKRIACNVSPGTVLNTQVNWQGDQYAAVECELVFDEQRDQSTAYNLIGL
jgi:hypothetical protein